MGIIFSRECEYAFQAVTHLARKPDGAKTSIRELARSLRIPHHFLAKILQRLTRKGLLASAKGPTGGFGLSAPAKNITLVHIADAIDGVDFVNNCVLGFAECSGNHPCAVHAEWGKIRDTMYEMLVSRNVAQMGAAMKKPGYELAGE
jgi:Rrf2 family transcriptional regulator, iron-sulfur cluster assembly transcription factor